MGSVLRSMDNSEGVSKLKGGIGAKEREGVKI